ncbi:hypothetical protein FDECE_508 [Fusarium decemcellulare]|nr:hypothetical protein FDECE_508 [Fusarium decemcellulare]
MCVLRNQVVVIKPSPAEIQSLRLNERNLEKAVRCMHEDGVVVVEGVVLHEHLDILNKKMVEDAQTLLARGDKGPFNYNKGNIQLDAPPVAEYFFPSVFTNPIGTQIASAFLGPRPKWTFCTANAAMAASGGTPMRQPVHSDADFSHPSHPFAVVVNIPLVTATPENGSTEIWLGTHSKHGIEVQEGVHGERSSGRIQEKYLAERREIAPPLQPVVNKGSIVIRDLRLWHAGMGNGTDHTRVMIGNMLVAPWYRNRIHLEFCEDIKPILEQEEKDGRLGLDAMVEWVSKDEALVRYMNRGFGNSYDLDQDP